ncbi:uncharacterized protein JCM6883_002042 [Sporobolomyces salmoneus]|uniref:uncharacterized protein n=1 Tax=Sporobolomyces salmoneus TaxID=183962 RepID=UPI0031735CD9
MQSDPPSTSSPVAIVRTKVFRPKDRAGAGTDEDSDGEEDKTGSGSFVPSAFAPRRPPLQHSQSLGVPQSRGLDRKGGDPSKAPARVALLRSNSFGGTSSSSLSSLSSSKATPLTISPSLANSHARSNPFSSLSAPLSSRTIPRRSPSLTQTVDAARAGTDNACAFTALGRKRERIISEGLPLSLPALPSSSSSSASRRRSQDPVKERATKRRRSSALSSISTQNEADESMGDLSFSSTSTASTVDSLATVDSPTTSSISSGYFALRNAVEQVEGKENIALGAGDDERECAELLLGLGGFC